MNRILGILCLVVFSFSLSWVTISGFLSFSNSENMVSIGNVSVTEGTTLKCLNGELTIVSGGGVLSVEQPWVDKVNKVLWFASAFFSLVAGIVLVKKNNLLNV